jgi:hypothetical protein
MSKLGIDVEKCVVKSIARVELGRGKFQARCRVVQVLRDKEQMIKRETGDLDSLTLGIGDSSPLAALNRPWEVSDGDDEEGVAAKTHVSFRSIDC